MVVGAVAGIAAMGMEDEVTIALPAEPGEETVTASIPNVKKSSALLFSAGCIASSFGRGIYGQGYAWRRKVKAKAANRAVAGVGYMPLAAGYAPHAQLPPHYGYGAHPGSPPPPAMPAHYPQHALAHAPAPHAPHPATPGEVANQLYDLAG